MADPTQYSADAKTERFIRVIAQQESITGDMTEVIVGNAEIQPDGSVLTRVPANEAFTFQVLNKYAKRVDLVRPGDKDFSYLTEHNTHLQLANDEQQECFGCHESDSNSPHGYDLNPASPANLGAVSAGASFPNTNMVIVAANAGDTMAQALAAWMNKVPTVSGDIMYSDLWADSSTGAQAAASIDYRYSGLSTTAPVNDEACLTEWGSNCRTAIDYEQHIQPIWEVARTDSQESCASCHNSSGEESAELDLTAGNSYQSLFEVKHYYKMMAGTWSQANAAQCRELAIAPYGEAEDSCNLCYERSLMSSFGAIASANFFMMFDQDSDDDEWQFNPEASSSTVDHSNMLTPHELRLIAEWLDLGPHHAVAERSTDATATDTQKGGNEGVGNGEDPAPNGHDDNYNDGAGTSPGNPGSKGGQTNLLQ